MKRNLEKLKCHMDNIGTLESAKNAFDKSIFAIQLPNVYLDQWGEIKKIAKKQYKVDMNRIGPIVTTTVRKQILLAKEITEQIKTDERIRDYANNCEFPTKSVIYDNEDPEQIIDSIIFLLVFRSLMGVSHEYTKDDFKAFMNNGISDKHLEKMFTIKGHSTQETESFFDEIISEITDTMKKKQK